MINCSHHTVPPGRNSEVLLEGSAKVALTARARFQRHFGCEQLRGLREPHVDLKGVWRDAKGSSKDLGEVEWGHASQRREMGQGHVLTGTLLQEFLCPLERIRYSSAGKYTESGQGRDLIPG